MINPSISGTAVFPLHQVKAIQSWHKAEALKHISDVDQAKAYIRTPPSASLS